MTTTQTNSVDASKLILELQIDTEGKVTRTVSKTETKSTLEGTLLERLYPGIRVARVSVPDELSPYEQAVVENTMATLTQGGVEYKLIGASGAAKEGRFYFVDKAHAQPIAERFQHWPQAAIVYFSILMTDCKLVIEEDFARVLVVKDHVLGTNDCRGWIRESLYKKLNLAPDRFVQFRLAFDAREPKQAKGAFKTMSDGVADRLAVDIVLPESSVKPGLKGAARNIPGIGISGHLFHGPVVLGTKSVSAVSEMGSSYTLLEHASQESLDSEILPAALELISNLKRAWTEGDYEGLFQFMGKSWVSTSEDIQEASFDEDSESDPQSSPAFPAQATEEWDPIEAALIADRSGMVIHIPYVSQAMNRKLARRAYRILTGGGFTLPSFALADDGILIEDHGKILWASDWIPEDAAITSLTAEKSLTIRYPIRMKEDLLPVRHLSNEELVAVLPKALGISSLPEALVTYILNRQLRIEGTYCLHSKTAAKNGGDFDFDTICAMPSDRFPKFVESRIQHGQQYQPVTKTKNKVRSPWWNMQLVAMNARGNKVGSITDLKTSCLAAGRFDLAYKLVDQLQNALDSLKHDVKVDDSAVQAVRDEITQAKWLLHKHARLVSDLPMHLDVSSSDIVGRFYNLLRPVLGDLLAEQRPIQDFRGLFQGKTISHEMFEECKYTNYFYGVQASTIMKRNEQATETSRCAKQALADARLGGSKEQKNTAWHNNNDAKRKLKADKERLEHEMSYLNRLLQRWAVGKQENRAAWAQAMASVVTGGKGSGGVLFNTFPQEFCDLLAEHTGGKKVSVRMPRLPKGHFDWEGRKMMHVMPYLNEDGSYAEHRRVTLELSDKWELDFAQGVFKQ